VPTLYPLTAEDFRDLAHTDDLIDSFSWTIKRTGEPCRRHLFSSLRLAQQVGMRKEYGRKYCVHCHAKG
jgi:hypothetical protein